VFHPLSLSLLIGQTSRLSQNVKLLIFSTMPIFFLSTFSFNINARPFSFSMKIPRKINARPFSFSTKLNHVVDVTSGICYCLKKYFFGNNHCPWAIWYGTQLLDYFVWTIKCSAIFNYIVFLIIGVRSQIQTIFLISFLQLQHSCPSIHIRDEFSIHASQYHVAPQ
jgi:hypothetical protein